MERSIAQDWYNDSGRRNNAGPEERGDNGRRRVRFNKVASRDRENAHATTNGNFSDSDRPVRSHIECRCIGK